MNLLSRVFVKSLDFRESSMLFSDKDDKLYIAKNYTKWLFGEIDKLELIEVDLDGERVRVFKGKEV